MPTQRTDRKWQVVVLGIVAVVGLLVALIIGLNVTDGEPGTASSTPLISMLVALVPLTITSLLALLRTGEAAKHAEEAKDQAHENQQVVAETKAVAEKTQQDLANGVLTANMRQAIRAIAAEDGVSIHQNDDTGPQPVLRPVDPTEGEIPGRPGH